MILTVRYIIISADMKMYKLLLLQTFRYRFIAAKVLHFGKCNYSFSAGEQDERVDASSHVCKINVRCTELCLTVSICTGLKIPGSM